MIMSPAVVFFLAKHTVAVHLYTFMHFISILPYHSLQFAVLLILLLSTLALSATIAMAIHTQVDRHGRVTKN
jgi:hypothetical protein